MSGLQKIDGNPHGEHSRCFLGLFNLIHYFFIETYLIVLLLDFCAEAAINSGFVGSQPAEGALTQLKQFS